MPIRLQTNLDWKNKTVVSSDWDMNLIYSDQDLAVFSMGVYTCIGGIILLHDKDRKKKIYILEQYPARHARGQHSASLELLVVCVSAESSRLNDGSKSEMFWHFKKNGTVFVWQAEWLGNASVEHLNWNEHLEQIK